jgi:hypothetical protein
LLAVATVCPKGASDGPDESEQGSIRANVFAERNLLTRSAIAVVLVLAAAMFGASIGCHGSTPRSGSPSLASPANIRMDDVNPGNIRMDDLKSDNIRMDD